MTLSNVPLTNGIGRYHQHLCSLIGGVSMMQLQNGYCSLDRMSIACRADNPFQFFNLM